MRSWSRREWLAASAIGALGASACASSPGAASTAGTLFYLGGSKVFSLTPGGTPKVLVDRTVENESRRGLNDGIALDLKNGHIYWTNMGRAADKDGWISRCNLDGSNAYDVVPPGGAFTPKQMKLDEVAGKIYWSDREGMSVYRCNLDGSEIERIVATGDPKVNAGQQSRWCVGLAIDPTRRHVYWTQKGSDNSGEGTIRRCSMDMPPRANAATRTDIETLFSRLPEPIDLDLDLKKRQMYWTDRGDNTVSRAPMDGARGYDPAKRLDKVTLVRGLKEAIGVALDLKRGRMAYTSLGGEVGMSNLDGSDARMLATEQGTLTGIAWG